MKDWFMGVVGGAIIAVAVWLIIIFAPQVLLFLEGIGGIVAGIAGGVILAIGASGIKSNLQEKKRKKTETAEADSAGK